MCVSCTPYTISLSPPPSLIFFLLFLVHMGRRKTQIPAHPPLDETLIMCTQFSCLKHNPCYCLYLLICLQEEAEGFIQRQIFKEFGFVDVGIEDVAIDCPFKSKRIGTFTATLRGSRAMQLRALIKSQGISAFTLKRGQLVTLEVCTNECSQVEPATASKRPWISKAGGVVIAVTVIAVMVAGTALLIVILLRYRR